MEKLMPPFASLTDQQRWDVVAYALTLSLPPEDVEAGRLLFEANCPACPESLFREQARMASLSQAAMMEWLKQGGDGLPALGNQLSESELWMMTAYLRTLSFAAPPSAQAAAPAATSGLPAETPAVSTPEAETGLVPAGMVSGTVVNGSGGDLPPALIITLHGFDQDASGRLSEVVNIETTVAEDGTFAFSNVPMALNRVFIAVVEYGGVEYTSALAYARDDQSSITLPITLYETTTDTSALSVDRWHIFLNFETPGLVQVIELWVISNPENRVVTSAAAGEPVLSFNLPEAASNLQLEDGQLGDGRYVRTANGFGDLAPIKPGMGAFQIAFAYDLPYTRSIELSRFTSLPVVSAMVMAPEGMKVEGDLLQRGETRQFQDTSVTIYSTQPLPAGAMLTFTVSGKPRTGAAANPAGQQTLLLILALLGLLLIFAGLYLFWRERSRPVLETQPAPLDADSLMDAIIALDDLYKAGKLGEESYQTRRAELKSLLKDRLLDK
jgi:hypothetical protein